MIEHEQRMIAGAPEMAVIGRAFLAAMDRANGTVHIQDDGLELLTSMHRVNPHARQIGKGSEVVILRQKLGLEPAHLAGGCAATLDGLAADNPAHHGQTGRRR
jgi:hypothetical protein